jgi:hypothetical protein
VLLKNSSCSEDGRKQINKVKGKKERKKRKSRERKNVERQERGKESVPCL